MEVSTRVVLDTNVLVAAAYNPASASRRVIEACLGGELTAVLSPSLRGEYEFILARAVRQQPYLKRLHLLLERAEVIEPARTPRVVPDDPDDKLVAAALAAGAVLITNDAHLLAVAGHEGLEVIRPAKLRLD